MTATLTLLSLTPNLAGYFKTRSANSVVALIVRFLLSSIYLIYMYIGLYRACLWAVFLSNAIVPRTHCVHLTIHWYTRRPSSNFNKRRFLAKGGTNQPYGGYGNSTRRHRYSASYSNYYCYR